MDDETLSTLAEELSKAQDEMLAESLQYGKPTLWARFNNWLWPDCNMCAGWRGIGIGMLSILLPLMVLALYLG